MTAVWSGVLAALGCVLWVGDRSGVARRRVTCLLGPRAQAREPSVALRPARGRASPRALLLTAATGLGSVAGWLLGGVSWAVVTAGSVLGVGWVVAGRDAAALRARRQAEAAALPRAADLLAACLAAGGSPSHSVELVAAAVGAPLAARLDRVAAALRLGADPSDVWGSLDAEDPLAPLVRAFTRAAATGAPLADTVSGVADDQRQRHRWRAEAAARRAGVLAVGPLALCFLPAFVLVGVVPIVLGIAGEVLGDLR